LKERWSDLASQVNDKEKEQNKKKELRCVLLFVSKSIVNLHSPQFVFMNRSILHLA